MLRAADDLLESAVRLTLAALDLSDQDKAAAKAALMIAENIDAHTDKVYAMRWLMPELLKYLIELGATPAARATITRATKTGGDNAPAAVSWLEQQRQSRTARSTRRA
jgi:hypothetical protein